MPVPDEVLEQLPPGAMAIDPCQMIHDAADKLLNDPIFRARVEIALNVVASHEDAQWSPEDISRHAIVAAVALGVEEDAIRKCAIESGIDPDTIKGVVKQHILVGQHPILKV